MIDIIIEHPKDTLYPWWMEAMRQNRDRFNRLIVVMTQRATDLDFTEYLRSSIPNLTIIESYLDDGKDWRNAAITEALGKSDADRILFLEQDFLFEKSFLDRVLGMDANTVGFYEGTRLHPAFLLVKKSVLQNTRQDFSVDPDKGDHFSKLTTDLEKLGDIKTLDGNDWKHLSGLTQNYRLQGNFHNAQEFWEYLKLCEGLPQHSKWVDLSIIKRREAAAWLEFPNPELTLGGFFIWE